MTIHIFLPMSVLSVNDSVGLEQFFDFVNVSTENLQLFLLDQSEPSPSMHVIAVYIQIVRALWARSTISRVRRDGWTRWPRSGQGSHGT